MPTPASTTTLLADISQSLWSCTLLQQNALNNGSLNINQGRDIVLMLENYGLAYGIANNLAGVDGVNNYVYQLIGGNLAQSQELLSSGSGGVVPTPSGGSGTGTYYPINIVVAAGDISGTYTLTNVDWKNLISLSPSAILNDSPQTLNSNYSYNVISGTFDFSLSSYQPQVGDTFATFGFKTA